MKGGCETIVAYLVDVGVMIIILIMLFMSILSFLLLDPLASILINTPRSCSDRIYQLVRPFQGRCWIAMHFRRLHLRLFKFAPFVGDSRSVRGTHLTARLRAIRAVDGIVIVRVLRRKHEHTVYLRKIFRPRTVRA